MSEVIGKGTWIDKLADTLVKREKKIGRNLELIRVESGLGASGIPHIGSMGDAVRAYGVALALQNFGFKSELIAYSDDMDGLRKIPVGLPSWLKDHIAKPVSRIPDPFGSCHTSYGAHMSSLLLDGLDRAGIQYTFKSAADMYSSGKLAKQTDIILRKSAELGRKIAEIVGQEKFTQVLPYFPICGNCGRLYTASAEKYLEDRKKVSYVCSGSTLGKVEVAGCGHSGEADIGKGDGKLAWKVEFAARWQALDIRFEAYGKDIMDSVRVNDWVSDEILGYPHPLHVKYEMFLDKTGKKISKSAGNVLTPQAWLRYGTPESILLLLFKRIAGTRHVGIDDIPALMDEYDSYEDYYFGKIKEENAAKLLKIKGIYEYINKLSTPQKSSGQHIPYRFIVQQASLLSSEKDRAKRYEKIFGRLLKYGAVKEKDKTSSLTNRIELATNWADDSGYSIGEEAFEVQMSDKQRQAVRELIQALKKYSVADVNGDDPELAKTIQSAVFDIARKNEMEPKEFFTLLYRMLLNSDRGPRIGNYVLDVGVERFCAILEKYL